MNKKILYINFNIIMHPVMNLYLHSIDNLDQTPNEIWEELNDKLNLQAFVQYDPETLLSISNLLNRFANKKNIQKPQSPKTLLEQLSQEDEIVYVDFEDSFSSALGDKTWIHSSHSNLNKTNEQVTKYLLNNLTQFFETKNKFDEVYFYFPPEQVPYKFYHLYKLIRKYCIQK